MRLNIVVPLLLLSVMLALPVAGQAQEAALSGTVTDATGGLLSGVAVRAVHEASGNSFEAVTDERGTYKFAVRIGSYRITAELQGFATVAREGVELLVGQQAVVNIQMVPVIEQSVSVTATEESLLIDATQSTLSGNIDSRQMQDLPINGRNWLDLVIMAPGNRNNAVDDRPTARERADYQVNVDGQQVTQNLVGGQFGQPTFSREAISEFQFVASRFDATQGRSSGVQVNAVTKSGTNTPSGTLAGYFRHDRFNAADLIEHRVLPYSNQQMSATFGGPIRKDKVHFFMNYEYEREPQTITFNSPWSRFNIDLTGTRRERMGGVRLDFQLPSETRLMVRGNTAGEWVPYDAAVNHPSSAQRFDRHMDEVYTTLSQVLSNRTLNAVKAGYASYYWRNNSVITWPNHPQALAGITNGSPRINFRGYSIGQGNTNVPQRILQNTYSIRDDFTHSYSKGHDLKLGGEYLYVFNISTSCRLCMGVLDAQDGPIPENIEDLFPVWNDISTWNLAALSPIVRRYQISVGNFRYEQARHVTAAWIHDDWTLTPRLTLNLGVRYDLATGMFGNSVALLPFLQAHRPNDTNNFAPRLGFAFSLSNQTVLRGGFGKYFGEVLNNISSFTISSAQLASIDIPNDGRADFAANPFNGPTPTFEQAVARYCSTQNVPGCLRRNPDNLASPNAQVPSSYQASMGMQRQLAETMTIEMDYSYIGGRHERYSQANLNLGYDPITGVNYPFTDIDKRPYPDWGSVGMERMEGWSNYHALQTSFTKRFSNRWQGSGTYTLSALWDGDPLPLSGLQKIAFPVTRDLGGEYSLAVSDQRHRAVFNGIWQLGYGFQLSGLYFFGSGMRFATSYGGDLRKTGTTGGRLRPDGTIVPRNNLVGNPIQRVDLRIQRRLRFGGHVAVDGILEVFNLFNHENYGTYTTAESNPNYGKPLQNTNVAFQPRMLQLGFRATF